MTTQTKSSKFIEYMKIHLISLIQDRDMLVDETFDWHFVSGNIAATEHLLSVATDIMNDNLQGKGY